MTPILQLPEVLPLHLYQPQPSAQQRRSLHNTDRSAVAPKQIAAVAVVPKQTAVVAVALKQTAAVATVGAGAAAR